MSTSPPPSAPAHSPSPASLAPIPWDEVRQMHGQAADWVEGSCERALADAGPAQPLVMRVNQLDAGQLDDELGRLLQHYLSGAFKYLNPQTLGRFKPELDALLQLLVYRFSVHVDAPSPGNLLQNLRYRNERHPLVRSGRESSLDPSIFVLSKWQKLGYLLLFVGFRWGWVRLNEYFVHCGWNGLPEEDWRRRAYVWCRRLETVWRVAAVVNFLAFLVNGKYRSLVDRMLGMRLVYIESRMGRQVSFEYMNQQLVWHGFSEFLLFFLPLIDFRRVRRFFSSIFSSETASDSEVSPACPVCAADPITIPYRASCGHVYCYTCLAGSRLNDEHFVCPRCHSTIDSCERV